MIKRILSLFGRQQRDVEEDYKLDLVPSPEDERDDKYAVSTNLQADLPLSYSIEQYAPAVKNQGSIGSCASHTMCSAMELLAKRVGEPVVPLSELYHYYMVRQQEFMDSFPEDSGQYLRDMAKCAVKEGVAPEVLWRYNTDRFNDEPSYWAHSFARFFKPSSYHRCFSINGIKQALLRDNPVPFGIKVRQSIYSPSAQGDISSEGRYLGGHAILAVGYDDAHKNPDGTVGAIRFLNSWGRSWGEEGYGWISYKLLRQDWIEAWEIRI